MVRARFSRESKIGKSKVNKGKIFEREGES